MSNTSIGRPSGHAVIGELLQDPEPAFLASDHQLHALAPAFDDFIERERAGRVMREGTVEHLAVRGPSRVIHGHEIRGPGFVLPVPGCRTIEPAPTGSRPRPAVWRHYREQE
jgi:hypothetical protein